MPNLNGALGQLVGKHNAVTITGICAILVALGGVYRDIEIKLMRLDYAMRQQWTAQDMHVWELQLSHQNPSLTVPDAARIVADRTITALQPTAGTDY